MKTTLTELQVQQLVEGLYYCKGQARDYIGTIYNHNIETEEDYNKQLEDIDLLIENVISLVTPDHRTRMIFAKRLADINDVSYLNNQDVLENDEDYESLNMIWFVSERSGQRVINPFLDETQRDVVDPVEYYGKAFLDSKFYK